MLWCHVASDWQVEPDFEPTAVLFLMPLASLDHGVSGGILIYTYRN